MQSMAFNGQYRITVAEMNRKSHLAVSTWYNGWLAGGGDNLEKLKFVSAVSTQIILHSRITLYRDDEKLSDGTYELEDGVIFTLPMTEACLNDLPYSLVAWLIDAAGKENPVTLETFLAGARTIQKRGRKMYERLSASGRFGKQTPN